MKSRKRKLKPSVGTAVNSREVVYKYFPVNEHKSIAVRGERCRICNRITTSYCIYCHQPYCEKHLLPGNICRQCVVMKADKNDYLG